MIEREIDQQWQELQDRIENAFGHLLKGDVQKIAYKPQAAVPLLGASCTYREDKSSEINRSCGFRESELVL